MQKLFGGAYKEANVFVTGHTGFKGTWLCLWLEQLGAKVSGYSLAPTTTPNHFALLKPSGKSTINSVTNVATLTAALTAAAPKIIFHLAAQPLVRYSYEHPLETYETNVIGTLNVLEAARQCPSVEAIVLITTDKVYENREWEWGYRECDRLGGYDPYSSSKACAEILIDSYRKSYFNPQQYGKTHNVRLSSVRAGNVIGGGDWSADRLIPDIVKAASAGKPTVIRNPAATRPWQHVLECLSGYLLVGQQLLTGDWVAADSFNFGPSATDILPVKAVCEQVSRCWPEAAFDYPPLKGQPHEAGALRLDCSKAAARLHWVPIWDSARAIEATINWYRSFYAKGTLESLSDLQRYVANAQTQGVVWACES